MLPLVILFKILDFFRIVYLGFLFFSLKDAFTFPPTPQCRIQKKILGGVKMKKHHFFSEIFGF
jgi:hypothetical protein